jgi:hypothetical protein
MIFERQSLPRPPDCVAAIGANIDARRNPRRRTAQAFGVAEEQVQASLGLVCAGLRKGIEVGAVPTNASVDVEHVDSTRCASGESNQRPAVWVCATSSRLKPSRDDRHLCDVAGEDWKFVKH